MTNTEAVIMGLLNASGEPLYGLQLVEQSDGVLRRGTVYVTLASMADQGLIDSQPDDAAAFADCVPRRKYRATEAGKRAYRAWENHRAVMFHLPEFA